MKFFIFILTLVFGLNLQAIETINGAGASFPYPIYSKWFAEYQKTQNETRFNYKPIGSGGGVRQMIAETVDFGASDVPLKEKDKKKMKHSILQVPMVIGAVVLSYNLKGINQKLTLNGDIISQIFLGKITKWNDKRIQNLNKAIKLPNADIATIQRADSSGTTAIFTNYLSDVSPQWKTDVGSGKSVKWPTGLKAKGNDGVTNIIKTIPGSIGYIELAYAINNNLEYAKIINKNGKLSDPTIENVSKSAATIVQKLSKGTQKEMVGSIVNTGDDTAYPISAMTYLLIPQSKKYKKSNTELVKFIKWAMNKGADMASKMHYAPIPQELKEMIIKKLNALK